MAEQKKNSGKVWLVGAGPGDIGLLTEKGRAAINEADVIVYDALVSLEMLSSLPKKAEYINVGKRSSHHLVPQEEINRILLEHAQAGKIVVRLKGGDPFVFGRGGEELELLAAEKVPYEVVPGVTSAVSVPAYNGIPVTHRDYTSSFHVITGHRKKNGALDIDFEALVKLNATLVFLMGLSELGTICERLLNAGMDPAMPAAVLEKGTTCGQKRVVSTVGGLLPEAEKQGIKGPAIIVVGRVCALESEFAWFEKKPLFGRQILVTRPPQKESLLTKKLRALGAQVVELPSIETAAIPNFGTAIEEMLEEEEPVCVTFTSPRGVDYFFEELAHSGIDLRHFFAGPELSFAVIGKGTASELEKYHIYADYVPGSYSAGELGRLLAEKWGQKGKVWIFRARKGSPDLVKELSAGGVGYRDISIYDTVYAENDPATEKAAEELAAGGISEVMFTSASTVKGFTKRFPQLDFTKLNAVCIGEQTAALAAKYGMHISISKEAAIDSMIEVLLS